MTADAIKTMKLYSAVERIHGELAAEGYGRDAALPLDVLTRHDQLHYFGTQAVDEAIEAIRPPRGGRVLDIGSGFGGPARYFADRTGTTVTAVELQPDMNATASDLTARTTLGGHVEHVCGDILDVPLPDGAFDGAISYLALYHIPGRAPLFPRLFTAMKPGAVLFVEDLYARAPLNGPEQQVMREALYGNTLPDEAGYVAEVAGAGFADVDFRDMSHPWGLFCAERLAAFRAAREQKLAIHGPDTVAALDAFYQTICELFTGGRMGGARLIARKPG